MTTFEQIKQAESERKHNSDFPYGSEDCGTCWLIAKVEELEKDKELALKALPDAQTLAEIDDLGFIKTKAKAAMIYAYEDTSDRYYLNVLDEIMPGWEK